MQNKQKLSPNLSEFLLRMNVQTIIDTELNNSQVNLH